MSMEKLADDDVAVALARLNAAAAAPWQVVDGKLHKVFVLKDFVAAFGFMTQAAIIAERMDHHPEWRNVYKTVAVDLTTHSAGGITRLDFELAAAMDAVAGGR